MPVPAPGPKPPMSGALLPIAVAAGVVLAFGVLDQKLHVTDTLADGID